MPLYYVDPHRMHSRRYRALEEFGRSRAGQFLARHFVFRVDPWLYRLSGGRYPRILGGCVTAPLISTGAKSGRPRVCQLAYLHDGPDVILMASNYAKPHHPGWYFNLKAHPECQLGGQKFVATEVSHGDGYARLYALAEKVYAGYRDYQTKTAQVGRRIPVLRLRPSDPGSGDHTVSHPAVTFPAVECVSISNR